MVTDVGGVDDKSFNQSAWEGVQKWGADNGLEKAKVLTTCNQLLMLTTTQT